MFQGETAFPALDRAFDSGDEGFDLQGVILVLSFDPEMAPGLEIKIEATEPGAFHIDHRIHLPSQILEMQGIAIRACLGRVQQSLPGVAKGLQLTVKRSPKGVHQQSAQIRGCPHGGRQLFVELGQAERTVGQPTGTESPCFHMGIQGTVQPTGGVERDLARVRWEQLTAEGIATILVTTAQQDLTQLEPHQPRPTDAQISLHCQWLQPQGPFSTQAAIEPLPALLRRQGQLHPVDGESLGHPAVSRRCSSHLHATTTPGQKHPTRQPVRSKGGFEVPLHHRTNGGHGQNATSSSQPLKASSPVLGQANRAGTGFIHSDAEIRSKRLKRTTHPTGCADRSVHRGAQQRTEALQRIAIQL